MKQTAVEWLCEQYHLKQDIEIVKQAKEMEKEQQGYSEEEVLNIIDNFCETFKVDLILREDFNQWFDQFINK